MRWSRSAARHAVALLLLSGLLAGCGASPAPPPDPLATDDQFVAALRLARGAFERGRFDQAALLYDRALQRAYARDDLEAIAEAGYERALTDLRRGRWQEAVLRARHTNAELQRRGEADRADIALVEAWALHLSGESENAERIAQRLLSSDTLGDRRLATRAQFLLGLIAAGRGDLAGVEAALAALPTEAAPALAADRAELSGHRALLGGNPTTAKERFVEAAFYRREVDDEPGVARNLHHAAEAAERAGKVREAADLYLRAARSLVEQRASPAQAKLWLERATALAQADGVAEIEEAAADLSAILAEE